jgi:carbon-monoxide dehydrogenase large subunit
MGRGSYIDDISVPGQAYAAILRSPYAHARIKSIDASAAERHPQVLAVITGETVKQHSRPIPYMYGAKAWGAKEAAVYCLAVDRATYVGEPVAAVVATDRYVAKDALELIRVEYEPLPAVTDAEQALHPGSPVIYADWGDNVILHKRFVGGDVDGAFARAPRKLRGTLRNHRYTGTPMEPRGYLAHYDEAQQFLTFYAATQQPHPLRTELAEALAMSENQIRVIQPNIGGAFGLKTPCYQEDVLIALLSIQLKRPVKWIEERTENFLSGGHAREMVHNFGVAFGDDGRVSGLKVQTVADVGAPSPLIGWGMAFVGTYHMPGVYRIKNCEVELFIVATNKTPWNAYRAYGKEANNFVLERIMDLIAHETGLDPAEVRRRNFIQPDEFPYKLHSGATLDSGNYPAVLDKVLQLADYQELLRTQRRLRQQGRYLGIGLSYELTPEGACLPDSYILQYDQSTVRMAPTGKVTVLTGITSPGTGNETAMAQVVADELGVKIEDVTVLEGDTLICPYGLGNFSGRSLLGGAGSALLAARDIKAKLLKVASKLLQAAPGKLATRGGLVYVRDDPNRNLPIKEAAMAIYRRPYDWPAEIEAGLESTRSWQMPNANHIPDEKGRITTYTMYPNGAHIAVVEVDPETGNVQLLRYYDVDDCGKVINPMIVEGQLHGGLAQGIGGALYEELVYDEAGQLRTSTFTDYLIPTAREIPPIVLGHETTPSPYTPLGSKGVGESGAVGAPAAIVNAVENALAPFHVQLMQTPVGPGVVWRVLASTGSGRAAPLMSAPLPPVQLRRTTASPHS